MERLKVYFDITINDSPVGRIEMELLKDVAPITVENFRALCTGEKGFGYKNSLIFRIYPGRYLQGGDITCQDGTGGKSIYGGPFKNENYDMKHGRRGILSMFNNYMTSTENNTSQFFITLAPMPDISGRYTAFGRVTNEDGMDILEKIEAYGSNIGNPSAFILISDCGQLEMDM